MTKRMSGISISPAFMLAIGILAAFLAACSGSGRYSNSGKTSAEEAKKISQAKADSIRLAVVPPQANSRFRPPTDPESATPDQAKSKESAKSVSASIDDEQSSPTSTNWRELYESQGAYSGSSESSDSDENSTAVDDDIWRQFNLADEYHSMGVLANREGSWEEAQYYFEKCLGLLANLDVESDSAVTPEAIKYNSLLENVIADYRVTLRSLGRLEENAPPSVLLERFADIENRLKDDSLKVYDSKDQSPPSYDLPVVMNDRVKKSIVYFQTVARDAFTKFLTRSKRYEPLYRDVLAQYDVPQDLLYLSMIESGFNPHAYSFARAMGLWQFISSTGRLYGLKRNWWLDERKDPIKATHAAARFLKDLYEQFGDWELAMAAYNGGPGRVSRTIAKQKTDDFWKLKLRQQTMDYVPLIFAAAIISKDPDKYGFGNIEFEAPIQWEEVKVNKALTLSSIAKSIGCDEDALKTLNPELLRNTTPPNVKDYSLKVPVGYREPFMASYDNMTPSHSGNWVTHSVKKGETVSSIASKYGISKYAIYEANNMDKKTRLVAGNDLIVPIPSDRDIPDTDDTPKVTKPRTTSNAIYTVRSGDTMWDIAKAFGTSVEAIRQINTLPRGSRLYVGEKLRIPSNGGKSKPKPAETIEYASKDNDSSNDSDGSSTYTVKSGDTIWDIARKYNVTTSELRKLNNLGSRATIKPGQKLTVVSRSIGDFIVHQVKRGETIGRIAQSYRTSIGKILEANNLSDPDAIQVGDELKIYLQ